jgi:hypothetical protein
MNELDLFSAGSANDEYNTHLWLKGEGLIIPQINQILEETNYTLNIINIDQFENPKSKQLGEILDKNRSDKSYGHNYHKLYSFIIDLLGEEINILEIGLGTNNPSLVSTMGSGGRPGASLYAFKEYLPKANIYGGDIDKNILFECDGIKTSYVDQLDMDTFKDLSKNFGHIKYDLIIDDGLHSIGANLNTILFGLKNIKPKGWIVIKDIHIINNWKSIDFILISSKKYKTYIIKAKDGCLNAINKL